MPADFAGVVKSTGWPLCEAEEAGALNQNILLYGHQRGAREGCMRFRGRRYSTVKAASNE